MDPTPEQELRAWIAVSIAAHRAESAHPDDLTSWEAGYVDGLDKAAEIVQEAS